MSDNIYTVVSEIQKNPPVLVKDSDGQVGTRRYRYLSLGKLMEIILPELNSRGVVLVQAPTFVNDQPALTTELVHVESSTRISDTMLLMSSEATPQQQGSAITYARRYALTSILGLVADEDDDGQSATNATVNRHVQTRARAAVSDVQEPVTPF